MQSPEDSSCQTERSVEILGSDGAKGFGSQGRSWGQSGYCLSEMFKTCGEVWLICGMIGESYCISLENS